MPFFDFHDGVSNLSEKAYDFCIVGAGAAGILLSCRLSDAGKRVLLLESGHFFEDDSRQNLNTVVNTSKVLESAVWGRKRAVGGTTIAWGGQSLPFSAIDFEKRNWVQNSGWPITLNDLHCYYRNANDFMGIDTLGFEDEIFDLFNLHRLDFDSELLIQHFSKWAPQPNFRIRHEEKLKKQVDLIYNAHLTKISFLNSPEMVCIQLSGFNDKAVEFTVPKLILATGGIETNRILLLNRHQFADGIGNHSGWLGKCFMEHPCMEVGIVKNIQSPYFFQKNFNTHLVNKIRYSPKISISKAAQVKHKLLNASTSFLFDYPEDANPYAEVKKFLQTRSVKHLVRSVNHAPSLIKSFIALRNKRFYLKLNSVTKLGVMLEQEPTKNSFIQLSNETDQFNLPKAQVNWEVSELTWKTAITFMSYVKSEMKKLNLGDVEFTESFNVDNPNWLSCLTDVNHHMGGTRMSERSSEGVVDPHCKVWGHSNLFISSASVFPTGSHSNPTLTILALTERLAERLLAD